MTRGHCAWFDEETDEQCEHFGQIVKGLCPRHYQTLRRAMIRAGYVTRRLDDQPMPLTCVCAEPKPRSARIGGLVVADAFECSTCGRAVL